MIFGKRPHQEPEQPGEERAAFPHCDTRVLHAPDECEYCDMYPDWQKLRRMWGIAFTGHQPRDTELPCPADYHRPPGSASDHRQWPGNVAWKDQR